MKNNMATETKQPVTEPIVIADECGDSLWDEVLHQEVRACDVNAISNNASLLINRMDAVQECDATEIN